MCIYYGITSISTLIVCYPTCLSLSLSQELNLAVVGSQVVGLVPLASILQSAQYFMEKDNLFLLEEDQKIRLVGQW